MLEPPPQLTGYSRNPLPEPPAHLRCTVPAPSLLLSAGSRCWLHGIPQHFLSGCHPDNTHEISEFLQGTRIMRLFLQGRKSTASNCLGSGTAFGILSTTGAKHSVPRLHRAFPAFHITALLLKSGIVLCK